MKKFVILSLLLISISNISNAQTYTIFVKILDNNNTLLAGESVDAAHPNEIIALSTGQTSTLCSPTQSCGVASGNFIFNMDITKAINPLKKSMYLNLHLNSVDLVFRKNGASPFEYYKIHMENVTVASVAETASPSAPNTFQIHLDPERFHWSYIPQLVTGNAGTPIKFGWNKLTNTEFVF